MYAYFTTTPMQKSKAAHACAHVVVCVLHTKTSSLGRC